MLICLSLAMLGCGSDRHGLTGKVTLDGQPLEDGSISFRPVGDTAGPTAGATISGGEFRVEPNAGTLPGEFRVEITASRKTGEQMYDDLRGGTVEVHRQFLPARYNSASELTATVSESGPNQFQFDLQSDE